MAKVKRIYVEKKEDYAVAAKELKTEIREYLGIRDLERVRVLIRYDVEGIGEGTYEKALATVFSEPPVDHVYEGEFEKQEGDRVFSVEYLPGQFDQRADSAEQCVKLLNESEEPVIRSATTYVLSGAFSEEDFARIREYCINPVDSRETDESVPETLVTVFDEPEDVKIFDGFQNMSEDALKGLYDSLGLAMTFKDFLHIQNYFRGEEKRDPSVTEIRVLDTYWSDHCRHTTFLTELKNIRFEDGDYTKPIEDAFIRYKEDHDAIYQGRDDKFVSLMDIALMAMKKLRADGKLEDMEESDEINACSIVVPVEIEQEDGSGNGQKQTIKEEWLVFFKNETHNHPTEIEPFGGAATCLGGAIRDPLSGRGYVYQAMRVTGAADPTVSVKDTMKGKLPQKKLVRVAANGYSSYGNQIGLATGYVKEIYHPNYVAKRMEIGAVMGAAPRKSVIRESSDPGDIIILLGGRTGRDGCGGATGSSKAHTESSIETCGAEVQKGNAPTERKIQRLFRREEVSRLIKKCNDFGAGGVSVAIGELADGLKIDLDKVPKKYAGLDGTEIAISESQERMAVVVDKKDVKAFLDYAKEENLEAVEVAVVTEEPRLILNWRGKEIVNISRAFLNTNGAHQETDVIVQMPEEQPVIQPMIQPEEQPVIQPVVEPQKEEPEEQPVIQPAKEPQSMPEVQPTVHPISEPQRVVPEEQPVIHPVPELQRMVSQEKPVNRTMPEFQRVVPEEQSAAQPMPEFQRKVQKNQPMRPKTEPQSLSQSDIVHNNVDQRTYSGLWDRLENIFPKVVAFEDEPDICCLKIDLKDLEYLPRENWGLANNSFLLHGYYNFRYLILAKLGEHQYMIGVPGMYHNNERFMAAMFGFDHFKPVKDYKPMTGHFGYWYQWLRM